MELIAFSEGLRGLPPAALYGIGTLVFLLAVALLRFTSNQLNAKAPPVFEGIPFVGGIIKFVQARLRSSASLLQTLPSVVLPAFPGVCYLNACQLACMLTSGHLPMWSAAKSLASYDVRGPVVCVHRVP